GYLITFEGIEGSGKSSQMASLAEHLEQKGWNILKTREPGGTKLGERIRELLLDTGHPDITAKTELLLYLASRAQHFQEVILPALQQGKVVLCDRFSEATLAYQGYGRGLDLNKIKILLKFVTEGRKPDLTLLLDLEARRGLMRINNRTSKDRLEQERIEFYEKVRQGYLKLAKMSPRQIVVIDASLSYEKVSVQIQETVEAFLKKNVISKRHRP
ncbi:MAG: dTMP kinase, partial [Nitrospira sp.]|nr:dTMP kinase [Nitrospira sp.]